jgi:hypothetical protein
LRIRYEPELLVLPPEREQLQDIDGVRDGNVDHHKGSRLADGRSIVDEDAGRQVRGLGRGGDDTRPDFIELHSIRTAYILLGAIWSDGSAIVNYKRARSED